MSNKPRKQPRRQPTKMTEALYLEIKRQIAGRIKLREISKNTNVCISNVGKVRRTRDFGEYMTENRRAGLPVMPQQILPMSTEPIQIIPTTSNPANPDEIAKYKDAVESLERNIGTMIQSAVQELASSISALNEAIREIEAQERKDHAKTLERINSLAKDVGRNHHAIYTGRIENTRPWWRRER